MIETEFEKCDLIEDGSLFGGLSAGENSGNEGSRKGDVN